MGLSRENFHGYQEHAFEHLVAHPYSGLFMDMGLGKTVVTLTYLNRVIYEDCQYEKSIIVAPKRVALTVWKQEAAKWDHLKHLKFSIVWGTERERIAALKVKADIYVINRENVAWLVTLLQGKWPWKVTVLDESSSFKNHNSQRFKAMKLVRPHIDRLHLLTGTPAPNGLIDLWAQLYLLDQGERLEKNITGYRNRYFSLKNPGELFSGYVPRKGAEESIHARIGDICISMQKEDYLDMPPIIENDIYVPFTNEIQAKYDEFEEEQILTLEGKIVTAVNSAALCTKLLQFGNGAMYFDTGNGKRDWFKIHDLKLDALEEIIEDAAGQSVLVMYAFQHDLIRIQQRFPYARLLKTEQDIKDWDMGKIQLMVAHPASAGHGLNLQYGGHILVWFGLNPGLELYEQARDRLHRQGQEERVIMHRIMIPGTMDDRVAAILKRKGVTQDSLMDAIRALVDKHNVQVTYA